MKRLRHWILILPMLFLAGCEKDLMGYEGLEGVYFAVQWGSSWGGEKSWPYQPYTEVNFMTVSGDEADVSLKVMVTGPVKDYDRTFKVAINPDSTTAVINVDYKSISEECVVKAGEYVSSVTARLIRTEALQSHTLKLGLQLVPTSQLALSFPEWDAVAGYTSGTVYEHFDASQHSILFTDMMTRPLQWVGTDVSPYNGGYESGSWGAFSRKKLLMICDRFDLTYNDFLSKETMPSALQTLIYKTMATMLIERYNAKNPVLEDDGRLMWFSGCPWMSKVGVPWIPDEGYYN